MIDLSALGPTGGVSWNLNGSGQVVGQLNAAAQNLHAFIFDQSGIHDLHSLVTLGGDSDAATAINRSGQIAGVAQTAGQDGHAFFFDGSSVHDLGSLVGTWSVPLSINDAGQITGSSGTDPNKHSALSQSNLIPPPFPLVDHKHISQHAFLYSGGVMQDLGPLAGFEESGGAWVDSSGRVFGSSFTFKQDNFQATMWSSGSAVNINNLFTRPPDVVGLGGIEWGNDSGQLVGLALKTSGAVHGYLLTPISVKPQLAPLTASGILAAGPQIGSLTASLNPVAAGSSITVTASNITDEIPSATITQVAFYYIDSSGIRQLLGYGAQTSTGVWTLTFTVNLPSASYTLLAQAEDSYSVFGDPVALTLTVS
jgi:probable HAF family extracellular repeat protein